MKKIITMAALSLLIATSAHAQSVYEAAKINNKELSGTARFVGMGGAMGALGGDISTMGVNPAGTGIYRSNDASITFGFSAKETESNYRGLTVKNDKNRFTVENAGFVFSTKIGDYTPVKYVNFGFSYQRQNSFYKNMSMQGLMNMAGVSQSIQMAHQATNNSYGPDYGASNAFSDNRVGWLSALGWNSMLLYESDPGKYHSVVDGEVQPYMYYDSKERGGVDRYDFNISTNINDRFYLGMTIGAYDVSYRKSSMYSEAFGDEGAGYDLFSHSYIEGSGFDVKLGMIVRPFEYSPLRLGLSVHTPTFYRLTYGTNAYLDADLFFEQPNGSFELEPVDRVDTWEELGGRNLERDFKLHTPWLYNVSLGYTVGKEWAFGAEYEYEDYSSMKFKYDDSMGGTMPETYVVKDMAKSVSTFRLGAEYKIVPEFAIRAGYTYSSAAFHNDSWKDLPYNSITTDTDFANTKGISNYTFGFGYRGQSFYADMAYKYNNYKEDFYAFNNSALAATKVKNNNHQLMFTMGVRF